jgi:hypothetical protein
LIFVVVEVLSIVAVFVDAVVVVVVVAKDCSYGRSIDSRLRPM